MINKRRNVGIIGSVCDKFDGQTVKTKILYDELSKNTDWKIYIANTQYKLTNPIKLFLQSIWVIFRCKDIFILVSQNGAKFYFPVLYYASKFLKRRIYHDVIGGSPEDYIEYNPKNEKYLNSFVVNWVETKQMCEDLEKVKVKNAEELPNFKNLKVLSEDNLVMEFNDIIPLCTFSRVMKEKGIEDAIEAVERVNKKYGKTVYKLVIYGLIEDDYKRRFEKILRESSEAINYCGIIDYDKSVDTVKNYYALLFPTFWFGEGFPGTIVDAFSSGVPVIATDWSANSEIIDDFETGIIYPNNSLNSLYDCLIWAYFNKNHMLNMRKKCLVKAMEYVPEKHIKKIKERVENNGQKTMKENRTNL